MGEYTPEPWAITFNPDTEYAEYDIGHPYESGDATFICGISNKNNARRIVACVNAMTGVPTEMLEQEPQPDSPAALMRAAQARADAATRLLRSLLEVLGNYGENKLPGYVRSQCAEVRAFLEQETRNEG